MLNLIRSTNLPELHDNVHKTAGRVLRLRGPRGGGGGVGGVQQVLDGDLVLDGAVQHALPGGEGAVHQDLNLARGGV